MTSTEYSELIAQSQKQAISSLKQAQEFSARATEIAVGLVPGDPALGMADRLPTPKELIEAGFGFTGKVLDLQKDYALRIADILTAGANEAGKSPRRQRRLRESRRLIGKGTDQSSARSVAFRDRAFFPFP